MVTGIHDVAASAETRSVEVAEDAPDWLTAINSYREASGLAPVSVQHSWTPSLDLHLRYLARTPPEMMTGTYADPHSENPDSPYYTIEGAAAGRTSNLITDIFFQTGERAIDTWMTAPFHAMGIVNPRLREVAFATDGEGNWALDVLRGVDESVTPASVLFPGADSTVHLRQFAGFETPDPRSACPGFTGFPAPLGLPIFGTFPNEPDLAELSATLTLPDGRILTEGPDLCVRAYGTAVVILPVSRLERGVHAVSVRESGEVLAEWKFEYQPTVLPSGYWMLDANGIVHPFGTVSNSGNGVPQQPVDLQPAPDGYGYWIAYATDGIWPNGTAWYHSRDIQVALRNDELVTSLSVLPDGSGMWVFTNFGRVFAVGNAPHLGDLDGVALNSPILDSVATPSGRGYYMVGADGGIFTFGDAHFSGSMGGLSLNAPVRAIVPDTDGAGYWLVASDGGVFAFDAAFRGSMGGTRLNAPIVGMVSFGVGYLMVGADGGVFNFSDLPFHGSFGGRPLASPIVAIAAYVED